MLQVYLPLFNMSYSVGQLHRYAVQLYKSLEKETGKNVGFSVVSNIRLAQTQDRMDEYHQYAGVAKTIGVDVKFLKTGTSKRDLAFMQHRWFSWRYSTSRGWIYSTCRFNSSNGNRSKKSWGRNL